MSSSTNARKLYNPKSHAPAVYIPCWLSQVPSSKLSLCAKILYGRLAQWSNSRSIVHRTVNQLAHEIGASHGVVKRHLKELREVGLIETYQTEAGGDNHYRFLDHDWIHAPLLDVFDYPPAVDKSQGSNENEGGGRVKNDLGVGSKMTLGRVKNDLPKVKEVKVNKKNRAASLSSDFLKTKSQKLTAIPDDFVPDDKGCNFLWETANRVKMPTNELLVKFISVSKNYKTKSANWQQSFIEFLERERPKRTYEDSSGKLKRYDGGQLHY